MWTWTSIKLPRSQWPTFPDRCVACGVERPGESAVVPYSFVSVFFKLFVIFKLAHKAMVRAPTCSLCRRAERKRRLLLVPVVLVLAAISLSLAIFVVFELLNMAQWFGNMPQWFGIFQHAFEFALVAAIFLPPVLVCDRLMPSAVEIGIEGGELVFKFRDALYARDFEALNTRAADLQRQALALESGKGEIQDYRA
jgi:hypothetical protein